MLTEFYYIGAADTSAETPKYHQHDDVLQTVTEISSVRSSEIGYGRGKIHQPAQDTALLYGCILYFCDVIEYIGVNRTDLVKWSGFIHDYLISNL